VSFKDRDRTSANDDKMMDLLWGKDKVRSARNDAVGEGGPSKAHAWLLMRTHRW
jgi:hypothetical protein